MENLLFIKIEIFVFIFSFLFISYYLIDVFLKTYIKIKKKVKPEKIENTKTALNKVNLTSKKDSEISKNRDINKISEEDKHKVSEILKRVKINSWKWYFDTAKNLIVEWLSIDKYNRELNIELASIYEKEKNYINAEYIYKDLIDYLKVDIEVMKKLAYILAMQNKLKESLEMYEKIHHKKMSDDEVIDFLSELTFNMKDYKKALKYTNLFLVSKPRNVDKLFIKAECLDKTSKIQESIQIYKRILDLQPYNTRAKDWITRLEESLTISWK